MSGFVNLGLFGLVFALQTRLFLAFCLLSARQLKGVSLKGREGKEGVDF